MSDHRPAYDRFVAELARYPDMINRLLAWHPLVGDCEACRLPGAQVAITAPCSIRVLAERAREISDAGTRASETDPITPTTPPTQHQHIRPKDPTTAASAGSTRFLQPPRLPDHDDGQVLHVLR